MDERLNIAQVHVCRREYPLHMDWLKITYCIKLYSENRWILCVLFSLLLKSTSLLTLCLWCLTGELSLWQHHTAAKIKSEPEGLKKKKKKTFGSLKPSFTRYNEWQWMITCSGALSLSLVGCLCRVHSCPSSLNFHVIKWQWMEQHSVWTANTKLKLMQNEKSHCSS